MRRSIFRHSIHELKTEDMMYSSNSGMFKAFNRNSFFNDPVNGKEKRTIFGNQIPQIAKAKESFKSSACCVFINAGNIPSGGFKMNSFFPTIWKHNMSNILVGTMAFGEECCNN